MMKTLLVGTLLLNYLLVVMATNVPTVNAVKYSHAYSAENPYLHAHDCQTRFYLQFDCLDKCNDTEIAQQTAHPLAQHALSLVNGLDYHYAIPNYSADQHTSQKTAKNKVIYEVDLTAGFNSVASPPPISIKAA
jgi:hypothetical protein